MDSGNFDNRTVPAEFQLHVKICLKNTLTGMEVGRVWGITKAGQPYVFIVTRVWKYAVRLFVGGNYSTTTLKPGSEDNVEKQLSMKRLTFNYYEDVMLYVQKTIAELECKCEKKCTCDPNKSQQDQVFLNIPIGFKDLVSTTLDAEDVASEVVERVWGITGHNQSYVYVFTKSTGFFVRLFVAETHCNLEIHRSEAAHDSYISKWKFKSLTLAKDFVARHQIDLNAGVCQDLRYRVRKLPSDVAVNPDKYLERGDHIQRDVIARHVPVNHEAVYLGNGEIAHISAPPGTRKWFCLNKRQALPRTDRFSDFIKAPGQELRIVVHCVIQKSKDEICETAIEVVRQVQRYLNFPLNNMPYLFILFLRRKFMKMPNAINVFHLQWFNYLEFFKYNLFLRNCQHFVSLCVTGYRKMTDRARLIRYARIVGSIFVAIIAIPLAILLCIAACTPGN